MSTRGAVGAVLLGCALALGTGACGSSGGGEGAATNLDELGPEVARLRLEVQRLREEVRALRDELAATSTTTTSPLR